MILASCQGRPKPDAVKEGSLRSSGSASGAGDPRGLRAAVESFIRGSAPILRRQPRSTLSRARRRHPPILSSPRSTQSREHLRVDAYRDFINGLALPVTVNPGRAAGVLITMLSPHFYLALRQERGWQHEQIVDWMATTIPGVVPVTT